MCHKISKKNPQKLVSTKVIISLADIMPLLQILKFLHTIFYASLEVYLKRKKKRKEKNTFKLNPLSIN